MYITDGDIWQTDRHYVDTCCLTNDVTLHQRHSNPPSSFRCSILSNIKSLCICISVYLGTNTM